MIHPRINGNSTILGIESSCDDTAAAIIKNGKILSNITASQDVHRNFGGVVPELASRAHQSHIIPVINQAIKEANISSKEIDAVAVTQGPGLMGSLIVGFNTAKALAMAWNKPLIGVNHLHAHIAALHIEHTPKFPMVCLLVSGGHTQLIWYQKPGSYEIIGNTIDDAVGEAFDKGAKIMNLGYPGGPAIAQRAASGNELAYPFPDSQTSDLNFSFSGIKTSLLYFLKREIENDPHFLDHRIADVCASYQKQLIAMLLKRLGKALKLYPAASIGLVGGVSANTLLRSRFQEFAKKRTLPSYIPSFEYCTDNAAMIAQAGLLLGMEGKFTLLEELPFTKS
jgi:N6-L-threonylcarbamoyladenine synthase